MARVNTFFFSVKSQITNNLDFVGHKSLLQPPYPAIVVQEPQTKWKQI